MSEKIIGTHLVSRSSKFIDSDVSGLYDPDFDSLYSDNAGDYFMVRPDQILKNGNGHNLWMVKNGIVVKTLVRKKDLKDHIYENQKLMHAHMNKRKSAFRGYMSLSLRNGEEYVINSKGMIVQRARFMESGAKAFSGMWAIYGIAKRWNSRPILWEDVIRNPQEFIGGYVYSMDNGSVGMWGGGMDRRVKSLYISPDLNATALRIAKNRRQ